MIDTGRIGSQLRDTVNSLFDQGNDTCALKLKLLEFSHKYLRKNIFVSVNFFFDAPQPETTTFLSLCRRLNQHSHNPKKSFKVRAAFTALETALEETKRERYLDYGFPYSEEEEDIGDLRNCIRNTFPSLKWEERKIPSAASIIIDQTLAPKK